MSRSPRLLRRSSSASMNNISPATRGGVTRNARAVTTRPPTDAAASPNRWLLPAPGSPSSTMFAASANSENGRGSCSATLPLSFIFRTVRSIQITHGNQHTTSRCAKPVIEVREGRKRVSMIVSSVVRVSVGGFLVGYQAWTWPLCSRWIGAFPRWLRASLGLDPDEVSWVELSAQDGNYHDRSPLGCRRACIRAPILTKYLA